MPNQFGVFIQKVAFLNVISLVDNKTLGVKFLKFLVSRYQRITHFTDWGKGKREEISIQWINEVRCISSLEFYFVFFRTADFVILCNLFLFFCER